MRKRKAAKEPSLRKKLAQMEPEIHAATEAVRRSVKETFDLPPEERAMAIPNLVDALKSVPPPVAAQLTAEAAREGQEEALPMLEALARDPDPDYATAAVESLGFVRSPRSAALLVSIERAAAAKSVGKSARRAIHRLRSQGIPIEEEIPGAAPEVSAARRRIIRSVLSSVDGLGNQALGLLVSAPFRGTTLVIVLAEDTIGIRDVGAVAMKRREFDEHLRQMEEDGLSFVDAPASYVLFRAREAETLSREEGTPIPTEYHLYRDLFYMPGREYERPLIYDEIGPEEIRSDLSLLEKSGELFEIREFSTWLIEPEQATDYAAQVIQAEESPIVLSDAAKAERVERIFRTAVEETFAPEIRALYKRRLEENAYVLLHTGRSDQARVALAAALALSPEGPGAERIPFAEELIRRSVAATVREEERESRIHIAR